MISNQNKKTHLRKLDPDAGATFLVVKENYRMWWGRGGISSLISSSLCLIHWYKIKYKIKYSVVKENYRMWWGHHLLQNIFCMIQNSTEKCHSRMRSCLTYCPLNLIWNQICWYACMLSCSLCVNATRANYGTSNQSKHLKVNSRGPCERPHVFTERSIEAKLSPVSTNRGIETPS